jgi:acyl homoserine lactone synthase
MNVMWQYSTGTRQQLSAQLFEQMGYYRREVFINQLGWGLNTVNGMELDEFDGPDAVYVCSHDDDGQVSGVARLLPTTTPYLMEKVFPELWGGKQLPCDPKIWELSRFAAASTFPSGAIEHQASAQHASELLRNVMRVGSMLGAQTLVTVSPVGMERLLRLNSFQVMRNGTPTMIEGKLLVSLSINVNSSSSI